MTKISIIIPVYKVEKYIRKCLDSILNQTFKDIEVILVDDGSPDNCGIICDEYAAFNSNFKVIHQNNSGVSAARNAGIKAATGEYIQFVDADDYIDANMCQTLLNAMLKNQSDLVICGFNRVFENSVKTPITIEKAEFKSLYEFERVFPELLSNSILNSPCNKLYKRNKCGMFDESIYIGEDLLFNIDYLINIKKIVTINECLYNYRYANISACNVYRDSSLDEQLHSIKNILNFCNKYFFPSFNYDELYYVFCMLIRGAFYRYARGKNVSRKIKKDMNNSQVVKIINKPNIKPRNFYDKLYIFLIKHKLALLFVLCAKAEATLIRFSPKVVVYARKIFNKNN